MSKMYNELAKWWPLVSSPDDYIDEAEFFLPILKEITDNPPATLLELGSGGGNNALHMKSAFAAVTLVDLSAKMLEVSAALNPDCEHLQGDMRTVRLGRTFDAVFIHDAIDYMTNLADLRQAIQTAHAHCRPGGMVLLVPDQVRETFAPDTDHGGEDADDGSGRGVRFLEWTYDPDPTDTTYITDYVFALREGDHAVTVEHDQHVVGLFAREEWLNTLVDVGFLAQFVIDDYGRYVFIGRRPE